MIKDKFVTKVIFRKWNNTKEIIALFPEVINYPNGNIESYMHIGQHGAADYFHVLSKTKLATNKESKELKLELENHCGYNLKVIKRRYRK